MGREWVSFSCSFVSHAYDDGHRKHHNRSSCLSERSLYFLKGLRLTVSR